MATPVLELMREKAMAGIPEIIIDHVDSPRNVGCLKAADAVATTGAPGRPPFMAMYFRIRNGIVTEVKYRTFGCALSIAAGSVLTEMITGRNVTECLALTEQQLSEALGSISADQAWCLSLALSTMRKALTEYHHD